MRKFIFPLLVMAGLFSNVAMAGEIKCPSESAIATVGFNNVVLSNGFWHVEYLPGHTYDTNRFWVFSVSIPDVLQTSADAVESAKKIVNTMSLKLTSGDASHVTCTYFNSKYDMGGTAVSYEA